MPVAVYNSVVKLPEIPPVARLIIGVASYAGIVGVALWMLVGESWQTFLVVLFVLAALGGLILGPLFVWGVIRIVNRRSEARPVMVHTEAGKKSS
jgi:hypothetical protein